MSPSPDRCIRLITMLQRRPCSASITPGDGLIGTSTPAMRAIFSDHGPVAFTTRSAWRSPSEPVTWSRTVAPVTAPPSTRRSSDLHEVVKRRAAVLGRGEEPQRHPHRVHRRVGNSDGSLQLRVQQRLHPERFLRGELLDRDPTCLAAFDEVCVVLHVFIGERDEQAVVLLERARTDRAQDRVLLDAFDRGLAVVHGVARPRVQQPMVAAGGARGEFAALDQRDPDAAQRQVVRERAARAATSDDQDVWCIAGWPRCGSRHRREYRTAAIPRASYGSSLLGLLAFGERALLVLVLLVVS